MKNYISAILTGLVVGLILVAIIAWLFGPATESINKPPSESVETPLSNEHLEAIELSHKICLSLDYTYDCQIRILAALLIAQEKELVFSPERSRFQ